MKKYFGLDSNYNLNKTQLFIPLEDKDFERLKKFKYIEKHFHKKHESISHLVVVLGKKIKIDDDLKKTYKKEAIITYIRLSNAIINRLQNGEETLMVDINTKGELQVAGQGNIDIIFYSKKWYMSLEEIWEYEEKHRNGTIHEEGVPDFWYDISKIGITIYHRGANDPSIIYSFPYYGQLIKITKEENTKITLCTIEIEKYKSQDMKILQRQLLFIYIDEGLERLIEEIRKMGAKECITETKKYFK